jgi:hypothetical protein
LARVVITLSEAFIRMALFMAFASLQWLDFCGGKPPGRGNRGSSFSSRQFSSLPQLTYGFFSYS